MLRYRALWICFVRSSDTETSHTCHLSGSNGI